MNEIGIKWLINHTCPAAPEPQEKTVSLSDLAITWCAPHASWIISVKYQLQRLQQNKIQK